MGTFVLLGLYHHVANIEIAFKPLSSLICFEGFILKNIGINSLDAWWKVTDKRTKKNSIQGISLAWHICKIASLSLSDLTIMKRKVLEGWKK